MVSHVGELRLCELWLDNLPYFLRLRARRSGPRREKEKQNSAFSFSSFDAATIATEMEVKMADVVAEMVHDKAEYNNQPVGAQPATLKICTSTRALGQG